MGDIDPAIPVYDLNGKMIARIYEFHRRRSGSAEKKPMDNHTELLKEALDKMGFETEHHINLDEDGIKEDLLKVASSSEEMACFWTFIFSNLDSEYIRCHKGAIDLNDLWGPFTGDRCKALFGKPKLFFIQADIVQQDRNFMPLMNIVSFEPKKDKIILSLPVSSDIMLAHFRRHRKDQGFSISRFLSEELSKNERRNMNQIMTSILGRKWTNAPKFSSTFCKQLYLPPGTVSPSDTSPENAVDTSLKQYSTSGKRMAYSFVFKKFKGIYDLPGADGDKKAIEEAMKARGFIYEDCNKEWTMTAKSVKEKLKEIAENKENADCVMIFVSTHGTSSHSLFAYDDTFKMADLWTAFAENDGYKGKPKIFIVDACRGISGEKKVTKTFICKGPVDIESKDSDPKESSFQEEEEEEEEGEGEKPNFADLFIGLSTTDGKIALQERDHPGGSLYIQVVCKKLMKLKETCSLYDIFASANIEITKTWTKVIKGETCGQAAKEEETAEHYTQMPTFTSSLPKDFYI